MSSAGSSQSKDFSVSKPEYLEQATNCNAENRSRLQVQQHIETLQNQFPEGIEPYPVEVVDDPFDLKNLRLTQPTPDGKRLLTREKVEALIREINDEQFIKSVLQSGKLFIMGIGTGGTISMKENEQGKLIPDKDFQSILKRADPALEDSYQVASLDAYALDSSELTIGDEGDLVIAISYIWENIDPRLKKVFAGFMIVHGTDTMPRSGAHMLAMLGKHMPFNIVHTGAQKPIGTINNDARINVPDAVHQLEAQYRNNVCDATTVMGRVANLTAGITKVSDFHAKAMDAYMHKPVLDHESNADPTKVKLPDWLRRKPPTHGGAPFQPVVYRGPNRIGEEAAEMEQNPAATISNIRFNAWLSVMATTYGAGTFDPPIAKLLGEEAKKKNIPLFAVSPVNADPELDVYDAAQELIMAGAQPLYMTREMARAKLMRYMARLSQQHKQSGENGVAFSERIRLARAQLGEYMADQFVGEIPTKESKRSLKPENRIDREI